VNPEAFKIIDDKLYLNWSQESADEFETNAVNNIKSADDNWNKLVTDN
jgi:hypothetical protein